MKQSLLNKLIRTLSVLIVTLCTLPNATAQNPNDSIPRFEMVSVDGSMPEAKPQLTQRLNGSKELIIVYPSNSSLLDETICTSLYDYFSGLGMKVSYHYAPYDKEERILGNVNLLKVNYALTDIDFVNDANTLVMIPNYNWAYSGYSNRLDIHLNIYDVFGGNYWKEIIDRLSIDTGKHKMDKKIIKKLQKQVTSEYIYNPEFSFSPIRIKFNWNERNFRQYSDMHPNKTVEGIYDVNNEKLGVHIDDYGIAYVIYLSGSKSDWEEGELKGLLEPTSTQNLYKGHISNKYHRDQPVMVLFENGLISISTNDEEFVSYVKMYPQSNDRVDNKIERWSGTGFALNNGYIITNYHVIDNAKTIIIHGINGDFNNTYSATVVGIDKNNDLALLKISDSSFNGFGSIPYSISSTTSEVGEDVYVLGYPLTTTMGDEIKLTTGIISSKTGFHGDVSQYQISAPIQPGNSGGPLFDKKGNIIGIVSAKHEGAENVGYAIKTLYLRNLVDSYASVSILPAKNTVFAQPLPEKVKAEKNYVFFIECSK